MQLPFDPLLSPATPAEVGRFVVKTMPGRVVLPGLSEPCLYWDGGRSPKGYGQFWFRGRCEAAHRVAWFIETGQWPGPMDCLHRCDHPPCVRFAHLFLGTNTDNVRDKIAKGRDVPPPNRWRTRGAA